MGARVAHEDLFHLVVVAAAVPVVVAVVVVEVAAAAAASVVRCDLGGDRGVHVVEGATGVGGRGPGTGGGLVVAGVVQVRHEDRIQGVGAVAFLNQEREKKCSLIN